MKGDEKVRSTYGLHIKHKQQQHNVLEHETKQLLQKKKSTKQDVVIVHGAKCSRQP